MVASVNDEVYAPISTHYMHAHEDGPHSSEEGSDLHSPVFETQPLSASFPNSEYALTTFLSYLYQLPSVFPIRIIMRSTNTCSPSVVFLFPPSIKSDTSLQIACLFRTQLVLARMALI